MADTSKQQKQQNQINEQLNLTKKLLEDIAGIYKTIPVNTKPILDISNKMVSEAQEWYNQQVKNQETSGLANSTLKAQGGRVEEVLNSYKYITENIDDIIAGNKETLDLTGLKNNLDYVGAENLKDQIDYAEKLQKVLANPKTRSTFDAIDKGANRLEGLISGMPGGNFLSKAFKLDKKIPEAAGQLKSNIIGIKAGEAPLTSLFKGTKLLRIGLLGAALAVVKFGLEANKLQKTLGGTYKQSVKILATSKAVALANKLNGMTQDEAQSIMMGINREYGNMDKASLALTHKASNLVANYGMAADNIGKMLVQMEAVGAASAEAALDTLEVVGNLARAADVPVADVMNDVAQNTEFFAKFAKDGGMNIYEAGISAKKLGLDLSAVSNIASSLLDFESSIEAQLEASMLLGRQINMDKARQLAFTGDMEGMMDAILQQVGGQAEFEKMNFLQREMLAKAAGTTVENLARLSRGNQVAATGAATGEAAGTTVGKTMEDHAKVQAENSGKMVGELSEQTNQLKGLRRDME